MPLSLLLALAFTVPSPAARGASELHVRAEIGVRGDWMGAGFGSLWEPHDGKLYRVDPSTNAVSAEIPVGGAGAFRGVGVGEGAVWIPNTGDSTLYRVDPGTNKVTLSLPLPFRGSEGSIGVGGGAVWIATDEAGPSRTLTRLDPRSGAVKARIELPASAAGVQFAADRVWVTCPETGQVLVYDARTNRLERTFDVGGRPRFVTAGGGSVWVLNQGDGCVYRFRDDQTGEPVKIDANLKGHGGDVHFGEGAVWANGFGVPLVKIDPSTNRVVERFEGSGFGDAVRAAFGSAWVSGATLHRIDLPQTRTADSPEGNPPPGAEPAN